MRGRPVAGAVAGVAATVLMTSLMRLLHERLPRDERYPLPPREIVAPALPDSVGEVAREEATLAAHATYGGLTGALLGLVLPRVRPGTGALFGAGVWLASYLGWIPAFGLLRPVHRHPDRRNAAMLTAHLAWGGYLAYAIGRLVRAERTILGPGPSRDAPSRR